MLPIKVAVIIIDKIKASLAPLRVDDVAHCFSLDLEVLLRPILFSQILVWEWFVAILEGTI